MLIWLSWRSLVLLLFLIICINWLGLNVLLLLLNLNDLSLILPLLDLFFNFFDNLMSFELVDIRSFIFNKHSLLCSIMVVYSDVCIHHFFLYVHLFTFECDKVLHTVDHVDSLGTALFTLCLQAINLQKLISLVCIYLIFSRCFILPTESEFDLIDVEAIILEFALVSVASIFMYTDHIPRIVFLFRFFWLWYKF